MPVVLKDLYKGLYRMFKKKTTGELHEAADISQILFHSGASKNGTHRMLILM